MIYKIYKHERKFMGDQDILNHILAGGVQRNHALSLLIKKFEHLKWSYAKQFRLNSHESEDAFMESIESFRRYVEARPVTPPLEQIVRKILKNKCIDQYRKKKNAYTDVFAQDKPDSTKNILDNLIEKETVQQGFQLYRKLSEECQEIFRLWIDQDLSFKQVAKKLGYKSDAHARKRKYHCWSHWKQILNKHKDSDNQKLKLVYKK